MIDIYLVFVKPTKLNFLSNQKNDWGYIGLNETIYIENIDCFDKWSKAPCVLPFPETEDQFEFILWNLVFWGTDMGFNISNSYDYDNYVIEYPTDKELKQMKDIKWRLMK